MFEIDKRIIVLLASSSPVPAWLEVLHFIPNRRMPIRRSIDSHSCSVYSENAVKRCLAIRKTTNEWTVIETDKWGDDKANGGERN